MGKHKEEVLEATVVEESTNKAEAKKDPEFTNIALGVFKDSKAGLWKVARIDFNTAGDIGNFKVIYETGFRDEASEAFRINVSRLGILG